MPDPELFSPRTMNTTTIPTTTPPPVSPPPNHLTPESREALRIALANADARMDREIEQADQWARDNPMPKLPRAAKVRIEIPGLPVKTITVRRWDDGKILAGNQITTAKSFGRKLGMLLDQFI